MQDGGSAVQPCATYETREIRDLEGFEDIRAPWQALHLAVGAGPFSDADWILSWGSVFWDASVDARVLTLWQGDLLIAALPLRKTNAAVSPRVKITTPTLQMLHDDRVGFHDVLILPGHEDQAAAKLLEMCRQTGARFLDLTPMQPSPAYDALRAAVQKGWHHERVEIKAAVADVSQGWEGYLENRSAKTRKTIRATKRKIEGGAAELSIVSTGAAQADAQAQLDAVFQVSAKSWKAIGGTDIGSQARDRAFITALFDTLGNRTQTHLAVLVLDGLPVAQSMALTCDGISYGLITDYDEAYAKVGVGRYIVAEQLIASCERGDRAQNFLRDTPFVHSYSDTQPDLMRLRTTLRPGPARWIISGEFAARSIVERVFGAKKRLTGRRKIIGERT